ncbi:MAG: hypothetical protein H7Y04_02365 [Verrucomicrobia bacterium]|nr:hypothetical protein [Cytophagales bacterium]
MFLIGIFSACQQQSADKEVFNLNIFLDKQIAMLEQQKVNVEKVIVVDGKTEKKKLAGVNWQKELEMFRQSDVLKTALRSRYDIQKVTPAQMTFLRKSGENIPVKFLKLSFEGDSTQISSLEAVLLQENYLYRSERTLQMNLRKNVNGNMELVNYHISGTRKPVFLQETHFDLQAVILRNQQ